MPKFVTVAIDKLKAESGLRPSTMAKLKPYITAVKKLTPKIGCQLILRKGENPLTVRNNLKKAAEISGAKIKISKSGDVLAFYLASRRTRAKRGPATGKSTRMGRPRKTAAKKKSSTKR